MSRYLRKQSFRFLNLERGAAGNGTGAKLFILLIGGVKGDRMGLDVQDRRTVLSVQACYGQNIIFDGNYASHGGADAVGAVLTAGGEHPA